MNKKINEVFTEDVCKEIQTAKEDYEQKSKDIEKEFYKIMKERILYKLNKQKRKRKIIVKVPDEINEIEIERTWKSNLITFLHEDMGLRISIRSDFRWEISLK